MFATKFVTTPNLSRMFVLGDVSILKLQLSNKLTSRIFQFYHLSICITYTFRLSDFTPSTDFLKVTFGFSMSCLPTKQGNPSTNKETTNQQGTNPPSFRNLCCTFQDSGNGSGFNSTVARPVNSSPGLLNKQLMLCPHLGGAVAGTFLVKLPTKRWYWIFSTKIWEWRENKQ